MEYKSPEDELGIDEFYKAVAYACLYKSYGETEDAIKADDVTVSLVREAKPEGLFQYFDERGYKVSNRRLIKEKYALTDAEVAEYL